MFVWTLPWTWGAGYGGTGPVITYEGPHWVMPHHVHNHRVWVPTVYPPWVEPGRRFADDPALNTFSSLDEDG